MLAKEIATSGGEKTATDPGADGTTCPVDSMQTQGRLAERQLLCLLEVMSCSPRCDHAHIMLDISCVGNPEMA